MNFKKMKITNNDLKASLSVFLIAVPLCLGIALASGAPASSGLIAGIIGGLLVGFFSPSEISVSGPAAGLTVIVAGAISQLGSLEALYAVTAIAGIFQLLLAQVRFGVIGTLIPASVIKGMLAAIGIIIILKQIPHALGFDSNFSDFSFKQADGDNTFTALTHAYNAMTLGAVVVSLISAIILLGWDRLAKKVQVFKLLPSAVVVVVASIVLNTIMPESLRLTQEHLVKMPEGGALFSFLSFSHLIENFSWNYIGVAITICLVASLESLLSIDASEKIDPLKRPVDTNKELHAQGIGNLVSGLLGGLPVTAVIVRSSANVASGGLRRSAGMLHAVWLLVFALFLPSLLNMIPLAALAMILIFVGFKLTTPKLYKSYIAKGLDQATPFLVTVIAILLTDLLMGVAIGFLVGMCFVIKTSVHAVMTLVQQENQYLLRFNKDTSFLNKPTLKKLLMSIPSGAELIIDGSRPIYIDLDIIDILEDFTESAPHKNIQIELKKSSLALSPYFRD